MDTPPQLGDRGRVAVRGSFASLALLLISVFVAACGSSDRDPASQEPPGKQKAGPIGPPPIRESITEARDRISTTVDSGDCDEINALAPLMSASERDTEQHCRSLQVLGERSVQDLASYGDLAGVIDYAAGDHVLSAILVRDSDGLFHIAFVNPFNRSATIGTQSSRRFDAAVKTAIEALRRKDCPAFLEVANRRFGIGGLSDEKACETVQKSGFATVLGGNRVPPLRSLGGNAFYAFYGLDTPTAYYTIVAAKQSDSVPPSLRSSAVKRLPADAATYGYVQAYATNRAEPGDE